jgi:hypothetical protein
MLVKNSLVSEGSDQRSGSSSKNLVSIAMRNRSGLAKAVGLGGEVGGLLEEDLEDAKPAPGGGIRPKPLGRGREEPGSLLRLGML